MPTTASPFRAKQTQGGNGVLESLLPRLESQSSEEGNNLENYPKALQRLCFTLLDDGAISQPEQDRVCNEVYSSAKEQTKELYKIKSASKEARKALLDKLSDDARTVASNAENALEQGVERFNLSSVSDYIDPYIDKNATAISNQWEEVFNLDMQVRAELSSKEGYIESLPSALVYIEHQAHFTTLCEGGKIFDRKRPISSIATPSPTLTPSPSAIPTPESSDNPVDQTLLPLLGAAIGAGAIIGGGLYVYDKNKRTNQNKSTTDLESRGEGTIAA